MTLPPGIDAKTVYPPIEKCIELDVLPETIWQIIATPGGLPRYHPLVDTNIPLRWDANKAADMLKYFSGLTLYRQVYSWLDGEGYDLVIGQSLDSPDGIVSWRISSLETDRSQFRISLSLIKHKGSTGQKAATRDRFERYLDSIVKGIAHLAVVGEPVRENQFGAVEGFSRA